MVNSDEKNEELETSPPSDNDTLFNADNKKKEQKQNLKRIILSMIAFSVVSKFTDYFVLSSFSNNMFQILSVLTSCLVITWGAQEEDFSKFSDPPVDQFRFEKTANQTEELPVPASQIGPEARNYVAYIPVPINDDEEDEEDEEYYDEYDEYYEDEYEYGGG